MITNNAVVHFEIPVDDIERAQKFYKDAFGWSFKKFDMPETGSTGGDPYYGVIATESDEKGMPQKPGEINGGMMKRKHPKQPFMNYLHVEEIETTVTSIKENGGEVVMPKTEIAPGMGWIAAFKDTEGNLLGLHQMAKKE